MTTTLFLRRLQPIGTVFTSSDNRPSWTSGFTLVEMAIALAILTLLLGSILIPLQTQVESRKHDETQKILEQAREALLGYAAAYGYLPCPADYALGSSGAEATGSTHTSGVATPCPATVTATTAGVNVYIGYLPAVTLGLTQTDSNGYAVDAWGLPQNRIRYAVSSSVLSATNNRLVSATGIRNTGMSAVMNSTALLNVCTAVPSPASTTACAPASTTLVSNAVAVIWSVGANAATTGGTSAVEAQNVKALATADRIFIKRDRSSVTGAEFDDIVTWISPPMLFNRLLAAGQLP